MATEVPVNITPPKPSAVVDIATGSFLWQSNSLKMHVIRPKSAKGRTRPTLHKPQGKEDSPQRTASPGPPAIPFESPGSQKPGACAPISPAQGAFEEIHELLQQGPLAASSSLNKYPVLPSISRRRLQEGAVDTVAKKASSLQLSSIQAPYQEEACTVKPSKEDSRACAGALERKFATGIKKQGPSQDGNLEEPSDEEPRLLLAVRSPSGQRFIRHFRPTDDLQTVVAVAEQRNKVTYRGCSIETMEVPRRRFSDLTRSLQECGIPHKSVLGISQEEREGWL
uniref:UBX domain-containing protein 10 n=1 Tax=Spermophilus dauricus TaxID=99837 RepID=A0A8C9PSC2_SPEDA